MGHMSQNAENAELDGDLEYSTTGTGWTMQPAVKRPATARTM